MASTDSSTDKIAAEFVAAQLERLISFPLDTIEDAELWDTECARFQRALETQFPKFEVEHHVWHFFTDSDIRRKNAGYRQRQHQAVADYIRRLRYRSYTPNHAHRKQHEAGGGRRGLTSLLPRG